MAAPPAAGVEAVAGVAGTVAALVAVTSGVEPLGRPLDPAAVPAAGAEVVVILGEKQKGEGVVFSRPLRALRAA